MEHLYLQEPNPNREGNGIDLFYVYYEKLLAVTGKGFVSGYSSSHRVQQLLLFCNQSRDFFRSRIGAELSLFAIRNTGKQIERPSYCHGQAAISGDPSFIVFNDVTLLGDQGRGRKNNK
jgi:hypothetical protein